MATMQDFNFGVRHSATPSVQDETRSRYIPSSVYSGPGPAEESPAPSQHQPQYTLNGHRRPSDTSLYAGTDQRYNRRSNLQRNTTPNINLNDPVIMHLLMETAISDSRGFEILSFEELEELKRQRGFLRSKVDGVRRQLGLEKKMQEAAQSLTRLYSENDRLNANNDSKQRRPSFFSRRSGSAARAEAELDTNRDKIEKLTSDLQNMEEELQTVEGRIMQHTAGILQHTHRGLKKNVGKSGFPHSPESMLSQARSVSNADGASDFDDRSLYQVPDYVHEYSRSTASRNSRRFTKDVQPIEDIAIRLLTLNTQLHAMLQQMPLVQYFEPPPEPNSTGLNGRIGAQIQAHLTYLSQGIEALESVNESRSQAVPAESEDRVRSLTSKLQGMLERTNSISKSPAIGQELDTGHDLQSRLEYSAAVLDRLNQRVDALIEQKEILTRQIQQQRDLNSKSDAQRDAHIRELTEELEETKNLQALGDKEMQQAQNQISLLMEQLDLAKQNEQLQEKQRGSQKDSALEAERTARKENETKLMQELQNHVQQINELSVARQKLELELQSTKESSARELESYTAAKGAADSSLRTENAQLNEELQSSKEELAKSQAESREIEAQLVTMQTELTMAKAELDGAYGSRAQRAADVSTNPEVKKQLDALNGKNADLEKQLEFLSQQHEAKGVGSAELQNKVNSLQKELKDTIEDYEVMTKASIDFEKERDDFEALIDGLNDKCEKLEAQVSEEKVKWLGIKDSMPPETTSMIVLKNEFKKMMRESRAENLKLLRAEQEERKRLEGLLREFKKQGSSAPQTPAKKPKPDQASHNDGPSTPTLSPLRKG